MLLGARQFFEKRGAPVPPTPYDARVLYVETDGLGAYIDTGVTPTYQSIIELTIQSIDVPLPSNAALISNPLFGAASSSSPITGMNLAFIAQTGNGFFKPTQPNMLSSATPPSYDKNIHDIRLGSGVFDFDGVSIGANTISTSRKIGVFCLGSRGSFATSTNPQYGYTQTRFYSCKIYTNNVLVFDGIPVRKDGAAYIYDRVSGRLCGNSGAAGTSVTYGPDVPFDEYVEYLESTGTQYVGTGIVAQDNLHAVVRFRATGQLTESTNNFPLFAPNGRTGFGLYSIYNTRVSESAYWIPYLNVGYSPSTGVVHSDDNWHVCELDSTAGSKFARLDGTEIYSTNSGNSATGSNLSLFARTSSTIGQGKISMFSVKNTSTGTEMVNFAPVRIGQTGYMYDRANPTGGPLGNGLYPNLGTGNFVLGGDT